MDKPMYALHRDGARQVLTANSFSYGYKLKDWLGALDVRPGDTVEFHAVAERPEFDEVPPAPTAAPIAVPVLATEGAK